MSNMVKKEHSKGEERVTLKIQCNPKEHKQVRMAAAELKLTITQFMRSAVLNAAGQAVRNYYQREFGTKRRPKKNPSDE